VGGVWGCGTVTSTRSALAGSGCQRRMRNLSVRARAHAQCISHAAVPPGASDPNVSLSTSAIRHKDVFKSRFHANAYQSAAAPILTRDVNDILRGLTAHGLPCFELPPAGVSVLRSPFEFQQALMEGVACAKERVLISTLYFGNGEAERQLAEALAHGAQRGVRKTCVLIDRWRGTRQDAGRSSLSLLTSSLRSAPNTTVALISAPAQWHTGRFAAAADAVLSRTTCSLLREVLGVHHAKLAIFDDSFILTGANISADYFTRRQDRYVVVRGAKGASDFFASLLELLSTHAGVVLAPPPPSTEKSDAARDFLFDDDDAHGWRVSRSAASGVGALRDALRDFNSRWRVTAANAQLRGPTRTPSCWLFPAVQVGAEGWRQETEASSWLVRRAAHGSAMPLMLSSPYLNLQQALADSLLAVRSSLAPPMVLTSAPQASSFWGARGIRGLVPYLYEALEGESHMCVSGDVVGVLRRSHLQSGERSPLCTRAHVRLSRSTTSTRRYKRQPATNRCTSTIAYCDEKNLRLAPSKIATLP